LDGVISESGSHLSPDLKSLLNTVNRLSDPTLVTNVISQGAESKLSVEEFFNRAKKQNPAISLNLLRKAVQAEGNAEEQESNHVKSLTKQIDLLKRSNEALTQQLLDIEKSQNQDDNTKTNEEINSLISNLNKVLKKYELTDDIILSETEMISIVDNGFYDLQSKLSDTIGISEDLSNKFDQLRIEKEQTQNDAEKAFEVLNQIDNYLNRMGRGENVELSQEEVQDNQLLEAIDKVNALINDLKAEQENSVNFAN
jgi:hypothetical protein